MNYQKYAKQSMKAIRKAGMSYLLNRPGSIEMIKGKEVKQPDVNCTICAVRCNYHLTEIDGTLIQSGDIKLIVDPQFLVKNGDVIMIDEAKYRVIRVILIKPADTIICQHVQLRR